MQLVPDDKRNADMVTLFPSFSGLALGHAGELLYFSMKLLDLPAKATNLFGSFCRSRRLHRLVTKYSVRCLAVTRNSFNGLSFGKSSIQTVMPEVRRSFAFVCLGIPVKLTDMLVDNLHLSGCLVDLSVRSG